MTRWTIGKENNDVDKVIIKGTIGGGTEAVDAELSVIEGEGEI